VAIIYREVGSSAGSPTRQTYLKTTFEQNLLA